MALEFRVLPVTHYQQNCSILWCSETKKAALVDPGGDSASLQEALKQLKLTPEKILLTHGHMDHVGAAGVLAQTLSIPIVGPHRDDAFWIDGLESQANMMGFPPPVLFQPDQWLEQGDEVEVGDVKLDVIHCPGHTPGHVVFYSRETKLVFVGDVLFCGSIGRTDFPKGNHSDLIESIRGRLFALGDDVRFIPGHGPDSTLGHERKTNPFVADSLFSN